MRRFTTLSSATVWLVAALPAGCAEPSPRRAERVISTLSTPVVVVGEDRLDPAPDDALALELTRRIAAAEHQQDREVDIRVRDGIVVLRGEADHLLARQAVEGAVANTPAVRAIVNDIEIGDTERDDQQTARDVEVAIAAVEGAESFDVRVQAEKGRVAVRGLVDSYLERLLVVRAAMSVPGVTAIDDELEVAPPRDRSDEELREEIEGILATDDRLVGHRLGVTVEDGRVTMSGLVPTLAAQQATVAIAGAAGAREVDLVGVRVEPAALATPDPRNPEDDVLAAAVATALEDVPVESSIVVEVDRGLVELTGTVPNLAARRAATEAALDVVGTEDVLNRLGVVAEDSDAGERQRTAAATLERMRLRGSPVVHVIDDVAHLSGVMASQYERDLLVRELERIDGIVAVNDDDLVFRSPADMLAR